MDITAEELLSDAEQVDPAKMARFVGMIPTLVEAQAALDEAAVAYEAAKARYAQLTQKDIPEAMRDARVRSWTIEGGQVLQLLDVISGSLPKDETARAQAFEWLEKNGHGGIVKHALSLELQKGMDNVAKDVAAYVKATHGIDMEDRTDVHYQTLQAWLRELTEDQKTDPGTVVPPDNLFNIYRGQVAQLARTKAPKVKSQPKTK